MDNCQKIFDLYRDGLDLIEIADELSMDTGDVYDKVQTRCNSMGNRDKILHLVELGYREKAIAEELDIPQWLVKWFRNQYIHGRHSCGITCECIADELKCPRSEVVNILSSMGVQVVEDVKQTETIEDKLDKIIHMLGELITVIKDSK